MDLKRSWMFVPGHRQRMIDKAMGLNTDAIMLDIEDGVAPSEKDAARKLISDALGHERLPNSPARFVRINAIGHERMDSDLEAVIRPGLDGLVLPKVETPEEVRQVDGIVTRREAALGMERASGRGHRTCSPRYSLAYCPRPEARSPRSQKLRSRLDHFFGYGAPENS